MVLETGGVTVFWEIPSEEDYAYTEVTSDAGFAVEVTGDTLAVDLSAELGETYTYTAVHYDVNGNASDLLFDAGTRTRFRRHHIECWLEPHLHGPCCNARSGRGILRSFGGQFAIRHRF